MRLKQIWPAILAASMTAPADSLAYIPDSPIPSDTQRSHSTPALQSGTTCEITTQTSTNAKNEQMESLIVACTEPNGNIETFDVVGVNSAQGPKFPNANVDYGWGLNSNNTLGVTFMVNSGEAQIDLMTCSDATKRLPVLEQYGEQIESDLKARFVQDMKRIPTPLDRETMDNVAEATLKAHINLGHACQDYAPQR